MVNTLEQTAETVTKAQSPRTMKVQSSRKMLPCATPYCGRKCQYADKRIPASRAKNYGSGPICRTAFYEWFNQQ